MATNRAPTDPEVAYSRDVINSTEKVVSLIQATIDDLEKRKSGLLGLIGTHRAAISPLRSFPPELLAETFAEYITMMEIHWRPPTRICPPLMLMGICSRWRQIILDTPRLWTKILCVPPVIDSWETRSKELPLHLKLDLSHTPHSVLEALISHSHRWEHANFCLEPNSLSILARARTRLLSLKRLYLFLGGVTETVDFCEVAPQLTEIRLTGIYESVIIKLPWEQLKVCILDNSGLALYALQYAKSLHTCRLDMSNLLGPSWLLTPRGPHSCHLGLDTLIVHWVPVMDLDMGLFFASITLPSLRTLEVHFDDANHEGDIGEWDTGDRSRLAHLMAEFFERSSIAHLSTLKLTDIPFSQSELVKCLTFVPSLVSLNIQFDKRWQAINNRLLFALVVKPSENIILPRLHTLSFRGLGTFSEKFLDALVTTRRCIKPTNDGPGIALLENLTLACSIPLYQPTKWLPYFHRFVSEGLNITYEGDWHIYNSISADS